MDITLDKNTKDLLDKLNINYINDKLHGLQQLYNQHGVLVEENLYSYGKKIEHNAP